ncbi:MAG: LuxR C-terminal-related transcriptional regulator [Parasphingorhabdus sp.]
MPQTTAVEAQNSTKWFSRSKTRAPKFSIPLVKRKRLLLLLDAALDESISCVVAPAGFGKSTLLSQWRESLLARDIKCAWINLDENDREIRQFFAYLVFAFEDAGVSMGYLKSAAENGFVDMSSTAITTSLLSAIIDIEEHMVLILDDYHRPASDEIDDFVKTLSEQCGDKIHIAIGSRKQMDINLPSLLAAGRAIEIPSTKLRFSDREVKEAMGDELDQKVVDSLQEQLEGWPVAFQMMRLSNDTTNHVKVDDKGVVGVHGHLADYLVTNVLNSQPQELQRFLLETSILESFNAELANVVCGHENSRSLIYQLRPLQALVVPLDDDGKWFRYHHLFSDCLRDELRNRDSKRFYELYRRAAIWCGESRMIAEAVNYANSIKDYDLSKKIINGNSEWMRRKNFGGVGYLNGLLGNIPEQKFSDDARMLYLKSFTSMMSGNPKKALQYHDMAELILERDGTTPEALRDRLHIGSTILARAGIGVERGGGWLNERLRVAQEMAEANPEDRYVCGSVNTLLAGQSISYGEFDIARDQALAASRDHQQIEAGVMGIYIPLTLASIDIWTNEFAKARTLLTKAAPTAVEYGGEKGNLNIIRQMCIEAIDYWQSDIDNDPASELESALVSTLAAEGWYNIYNIGFDAAVHDALSHRDYDGADALVLKFEGAVNHLNISRLPELTQLLRLDCLVAKKDLAAAAGIFERVLDWLDADDHKLDDLGWFLRCTAAFSRGRYLNAINQWEEALATIDQGIEEVDRLDIALMRVRGNILKASILEKIGNKKGGLTVLERAIADAARINCPRPFAVDVSDALMAKAVVTVLDKTESPAVREFAARLAASGSQRMFSSREEKVLQGLAVGKSNKEIARDLDVTDNTIKFHLRNIYRKLGVKKRVLAVEKAHELGVL